MVNSSTRITSSLLNSEEIAMCTMCRRLVQKKHMKMCVISEPRLNQVLLCPNCVYNQKLDEISPEIAELKQYMEDKGIKF